MTMHFVSPDGDFEVRHYLGKVIVSSLLGQDEAPETKFLLGNYRKI
jgi:hypothetical protein